MIAKHVSPDRSCDDVTNTLGPFHEGVFRVGTFGRRPKETTSKLIIHAAAILLLLLFGAVKLSNAQSIYAGAGTAVDSSSKQTIDTFGNGVFYNTPRLGGTFVKIGADLLLKHNLGFGGEVSFRGTEGSYTGLKYRPIFYDFNAIYQPPVATFKHVAPELQGGLGGTDLRFYYNQRFCDVFVGCKTSNIYLEGSQHFQLHFGGGVRFYIKGGLFVRPQVDVHWVNNFFQFGSNWAPEYSATVGYRFGTGR